MKCTKCGKPIKRGAQFCTNCGAPVTKAAAPAAEPEAASPVAAPSTAAPAAVRQKKPHSRKKVVLLIVCIVLALAVIGAGVFFVLRLLNPVSRVMSALESGDYTKALSIYEDKVEGDREKDSTLSEDVVAYLEKCQDDFLNERMSYEQFTGVINGIRSLALNKLSSKLDDAAEYADMLNQSRIAYQTAEDFYGKQDYGSAIGYYNQVNYQDTYYDDAQSKCAECITNYRQQVLDSADEQVSHGDYPGALATLDEALKVLSDDADLTAKRNTLAAKQRELGIEQAYAEANAMYELADLRGAIRYLKNALVQYDDESLRQLLNTCVDKLTERMKTEAEQAFQNGEWSDAVEVIQSYSSALGDTQAYSDLLNYYSNLSPVPLSQLDPFSGSWDRNGPQLDFLGNSYQNGCIKSVWSDSKPSIEYHLNGEYTSMSGVVVIADCDKGSTDQTGHIEIYGDDNLLFSSSVLTIKSNPEQFNISLSGVNFLKIVIRSDTYINYFSTDLMLGDTILNKY